MKRKSRKIIGRSKPYKSNLTIEEEDRGMTNHYLKFATIFLMKIEDEELWKKYPIFILFLL